MNIDSLYGSMQQRDGSAWFNVAGTRNRLERFGRTVVLVEKSAKSAIVFVANRSIGRMIVLTGR